MIRAAIIMVLALASSPALAAPCYDLGHAGNCPKLKPQNDACTGWRDDKGICRHGLGGSGMGPRGYVARCGGGKC